MILKRLILFIVYLFFAHEEYFIFFKVVLIIIIIIVIYCLNYHKFVLHRILLFRISTCLLVRILIAKAYTLSHFFVFTDKVIVPN